MVVSSKNIIIPAHFLKVLAAAEVEIRIRIKLLDVAEIPGGGLCVFFFEREFRLPESGFGSKRAAGAVSV